MKKLKKIIGLGALIGLIALPGLVSANHQSTGGSSKSPSQNRPDTATVAVEVEKPDSVSPVADNGALASLEPAALVDGTTGGSLKVKNITAPSAFSKTGAGIKNLIKLKYPGQTIKKIVAEKNDGKVIYEIYLVSGQKLKLPDIKL